MTLIYSPGGKGYGSFGEAIRECEALIAALKNPTRFAKFATEFPQALLGEKAPSDNALVIVEEQSGQLSIFVHEMPPIPEPPETL